LCRDLFVAQPGRREIGDDGFLRGEDGRLRLRAAGRAKFGARSFQPRARPQPPEPGDRRCQLGARSAEGAHPPELLAVDQMHSSPVEDPPFAFRRGVGLSESFAPVLGVGEGSCRGDEQGEPR
jgi:hypothetical protein